MGSATIGKLAASEQNPPKLRVRLHTPASFPSSTRCRFMFPRLVRRALRVTRSWMIALALVSLAVGAAPALAVGPGGGPTGGGGGGGGTKGGSSGGGGGGGGGTVPEINPNAAAAALTLLGGMTLILTDKLRRRQLAQT